MLINFLWGQHYDKVAGIDAIAYAETLGIPIIGTSSRFLSLSKIDFKLAASKYNILTPRYNVIKSADDIVTLEKFPVIVKMARACGSLHKTETSVCHDPSTLKIEIDKLLKIAECEILVEEYIYGREYSVMVIENSDGIYALTPIIYHFPKHFTPEEQFLRFDNKFELVDSGEITFELVHAADPLTNRMKEIACKSFNALHVYGSGYARMDLRVDDKNNIFVLEVNPTSAFFSSIGNTFGDDYVISRCFEGGHEALMDQLIKTKLKQIGITHFYDNFAGNYNRLSESDMYKMFKEICKEYDYSGDILDLGCGTGLLAKIILDCGHSSNFTGVDLSHKMTEQTTLYSKIYIGPMENIIYNIDDRKFDHIISYGCLLFLNNAVFKETLSRMFEIAKRSITITVEEIPDEYNEILIKKGHETIYSYNNKCVIDGFDVPDQWVLAYSKRGHMWSSPLTGVDIYGSVIRFENCSKKIT
ncbi:unnamed protein product [Rotaria sp. Silwood1]|nr:unnamed protein product [Rotaria sp. Silwood1]